MKLFLDVGAHYGETARVALNPKWGFDRVISFEPSSLCVKRLSAIRDPRLTIIRSGLPNRNAQETLYGSGLLGGSLYKDKQQAQNVRSERIDLVRASDWFRAHIPQGLTVYLKLNCEGGEADILDDLLTTGEIAKVTKAFIYFDVDKIPSQAFRHSELERRLKTARVDYIAAEGFGFGAQQGVEAWLEWHCKQVATTVRQRVAYRLPSSPYEAAVAASRRLLPRRLHWWLGHRFGRLSRQP